MSTRFVATEDGRTAVLVARGNPNRKKLTLTAPPVPVTQGLGPPAAGATPQKQDGDQTPREGNEPKVIVLSEDGTQRAVLAPTESVSWAGAAAKAPVYAAGQVGVAQEFKKGTEIDTSKPVTADGPVYLED